MKASGLKQPSQIRPPSANSRPPSTPPTNAVLTENTDDFIIGDRVFVGGTKPGHIQYIGETQFAPGEWAGVVLDEAQGKNDGSVAGVKYFQCEPKKGVFSRLTKLTKVQLAEDKARSISPSSTASASITRVNGSSSRACLTPSPTSAGNNDLKVGDRVQVTSVNGVKYGTLRYLGCTEFAVGEWAGVELDEAGGKNDGSVAGKRYFDCGMRYGLFAPVQKVARASPGSRAAKKTPLFTPKRVASQESLSTMSTASGNRTSRVRLGVTSLASPTSRSPRSNAASVLAANNALQESLREKEQHVDQLLRESDLERAELAKAANRLEESERQLATLRLEYERYAQDTEAQFAELRQKLETSTRQNADTMHALEEERRKVEDLQFREEEQEIMKVELEALKEANEQKIQTLEQLLEKERTQVEVLEQESCKGFQLEEDLAKYAEEIETLKKKLAEASGQQTLLGEEKSASLKLSEDLREKNDRVSRLEAAATETADTVSKLTSDVARLEGVVAETSRKLEEKKAEISGLEGKIAECGKSIESREREFAKAQLESSELQRQLTESAEKYAEACRQKAKLEADFALMVNATGDGAAQMSTLNAELRDREKQLDAANEAVRKGEHEVERLERAVESTRTELERERDAVTCQLNADVHRIEAQLIDTLVELDAAKTSGETLTSRYRIEAEELKAQIAERDDRMTRLSKELEDGRRDMAALRSDNEESGGALRRENDDLRKRLEEMRVAKETAECGLAEKEGLRGKLESDIATLQREKQDHVMAVSERDKRLEALTAEVDRLRSEICTHKLELQRKLAEENDLTQKTMQYIEAQRLEFEALQSRLETTEAERSRLSEEAEAAERLRADRAKLEGDYAALLAKYNEQQESVDEEKMGYVRETGELRKRLETTESLLEQRHREAEALRNDLETTKNEAVTVEHYKVTCDRLEAEKRVLESNVKDLKAQQASRAARGTDSEVKNLTDEKEALESQIDFLNSVIVDMQKKNDELLTRIGVLESGDTLSDGQDVNLNGVRAMVPPRLYCDICERFDVHDTEDCPTQAADDSATSHSHHHGIRNQERPYCDACEVFGHWTNECDDNETF